MRKLSPLVWLGISVFMVGASANRIESGLYLRTVYFGGSLSINTLLFGPGNKIVVDPKGGSETFDFDAAAKADPAQVGTYAIAGARLHVTWGGGKAPSAWEVEFENGKLSAVDGGLVIKADKYKKDTKLNGSYAWGATTRNVSVSHTLTFTVDGKYTFDHVGGIHHIPGNTGEAETIETGTYTLSGNTLTLSSAGGQTFKHTVIPINTALDPAKAEIRDDHMIFDGMNLTREK